MASVVAFILYIGLTSGKTDAVGVFMSNDIVAGTVFVGDILIGSDNDVSNFVLTRVSLFVKARNIDIFAWSFDEKNVLCEC